MSLWENFPEKTKLWYKPGINSYSASQQTLNKVNIPHKNKNCNCILQINRNSNQTQEIFALSPSPNQKCFSQKTKKTKHNPYGLFVENIFL